MTQHTETLTIPQPEILEVDATLAAMEAQFQGAVTEFDHQISTLPEVKERISLETFDKTAAYSDTNSGFSS